MAIIICKSCGKKTSDSSGRCMFCKAPVEKKQVDAIKAPSIPDSMVSGAQNTAGMPQSWSKVSDSGIQNRTSGSEETQKSRSIDLDRACAYPELCEITIYDYGPKKTRCIREIVKILDLNLSFLDKLGKKSLPLTLKDVKTFRARFLVSLSEINEGALLDVKDGKDILFSTRPGVRPSGRYTNMTGFRVEKWDSEKFDKDRQALKDSSCMLVIDDYGPAKKKLVAYLKKIFGEDSSVGSQAGKEPLFMDYAKYDSVMRLYAILMTSGCKMSVYTQDSKLIASNTGNYTVVIHPKKSNSKLLIQSLINNYLYVDIFKAVSPLTDEWYKPIVLRGLKKSDIQDIGEDIKKLKITATIFDNYDQIVFKNDVS